jgi:hypothetical protein
MSFEFLEQLARVAKISSKILRTKYESQEQIVESIRLLEEATRAIQMDEITEVGTKTGALIRAASSYMVLQSYRLLNESQVLPRYFN